MQAYIARRLVALVPTLLFVSLIVFVSMRLIPGDVIDLMLAQNDIATGQDRARIEAARALLRPKAYLSSRDDQMIGTAHRMWVLISA